MAFVKSTNKQLMRRFHSSILIAARDAGGNKRTKKLWVSIPKEWLIKAFGELPERVYLLWNPQNLLEFKIISTPIGGHKIRQTSLNIHTFWCNIPKDLKYFLDIDCGESDTIYIKDKSIYFEIQKRTKNDR